MIPELPVAMLACVRIRAPHSVVFEDRYFWLLGGPDDVMNVADHRLSTYETESALVDNRKVAGRPRCPGPPSWWARPSWRS